MEFSVWSEGRSVSSRSVESILQTSTDTPARRDMDCISIDAGWIETRGSARAVSEPTPTRNGYADYQRHAEHQQPDLAECQANLVVVRGEQQHADERERSNTERQPERRLRGRLHIFETTQDTPIGAVEPGHQRQRAENGAGK